MEEFYELDAGPWTSFPLSCRHKDDLGKAPDPASAEFLLPPSLSTSAASIETCFSSQPALAYGTKTIFSSKDNVRSEAFVDLKIIPWWKCRSCERLFFSEPSLRGHCCVATNYSLVPDLEIRQVQCHRRQALEHNLQDQAACLLPEFDRARNVSSVSLCGSDNIHPSYVPQNSNSRCVSQAFDMEQRIASCYYKHSTVAVAIIRDFKEQIITSFNSATTIARNQDGSQNHTHSTSEPLSSRPLSPKRDAGNIRGQRQPKRLKVLRHRNDEDEDDEDDSNHERSPTVPSDKSDADRTLLFACPYAKWKPLRYRACFRYVFKTVSRVKQHLRSHKLHRIPVHCSRCFVVFEKEAQRVRHSRHPESCKVGPAIQWEGITEEQRQLLNNPTRSPNTSPEAWFEVWDILFPNVVRPGYPFVDKSLVEELQVLLEHVLDKGPGIWETIVSRHVPATTSLPIEAVHELNRRIFPQFSSEICQSFQRSQLSSTVDPCSQGGSDSDPLVNKDRPVLVLDSADSSSLSVTCASNFSPTSSPCTELAELYSGATDGVQTAEPPPYPANMFSNGEASLAADPAPSGVHDHDDFMNQWWMMSRSSHG